MPLVVVELFTSEGCSSCPPADELLKEIAAKRKSESKPFIALSFHVAYWNHLGWVDPYSQEIFTDRQKKYADALKKPQIYTPQVVINGMHEFVGSNTSAFRDTLAKAEKRKSSYTIQAQATLRGDSIEVKYWVDSESKNQVMNIAILEKYSEHLVARGENKNHILKHFNVVREFETRDLKKEDIMMFVRMKDVPQENIEVALYIQHKKTMRVMGATKTDISE